MDTPLVMKLSVTCCMVNTYAQTELPKVPPTTPTPKRVDTHKHGMEMLHCVDAIKVPLECPQIR